MAEKVTITDFVRWIKEQIAPDQLSALMTNYNATDDSIETIIYLLETYPIFAEDLGQLLGLNLAENKKELNRSVGGVSFESNSLGLKDWKKLTKKGLSRATGDETNIAGTTAKKGWNWEAIVNGIISTAGAVAGGFFGTGNNNQTQAPAEPAKTSGASIAMWIIIGVVVLAIVVILGISLSKK